YPNQHDYDELAAIYAHLNETTTDSAGNGKGKGKKPQQLSASDNKSPNTTSEWGRAISQDAQGRDSVFERILGNGQILVTHVLWAI
ncbi:MAG: hypothetical protein JKY98_07835, partial [Gammaproteobacteria bacterium]|nr:hypothetical protein [Gammaproteobacteria bacterium]